MQTEQIVCLTVGGVFALFGLIMLWLLARGRYAASEISTAMQDSYIEGFNDRGHDGSGKAGAPDTRSYPRSKSTLAAMLGVLVAFVLLLVAGGLAAFPFVTPDWPELARGKVEDWLRARSAPQPTTPTTPPATQPAPAPATTPTTAPAVPPPQPSPAPVTSKLPQALAQNPKASDFKWDGGAKLQMTPSGFQTIVTYYDGTGSQLSQVTVPKGDREAAVPGNTSRVIVYLYDDVAGKTSTSVEVPKS